jgi:hypothetical protein
MNKYYFSAIVNGQQQYQDAYGNDLDHAREEAVWMMARKYNTSLSNIKKVREKNEKLISIFNFKMGIHKAKYLKSQWYYYIIPRRLTSVANRAIYKWCFWYIATRKSE